MQIIQSLRDVFASRVDEATERQIEALCGLGDRLDAGLSFTEARDDLRYAFNISDNLGRVPDDKRLDVDAFANRVLERLHESADFRVALSRLVGAGYDDRHKDTVLTTHTSRTYMAAGQKALQLLNG